MEILGMTFGLIFGVIYLGSVFFKQSAADKDFKIRAEEARKNQDYYKTILCDKDLEILVRRFVNLSKNKSKIEQILADDLKYITNGDDSIPILNHLIEQQKVDLVMSKFGKLSWSTTYGLSNFGILNKVGNNLLSYDISLRVMQCVESNLKNNNCPVLFGAAISGLGSYVDGRYVYGHIFIDGTTVGSTKRIYNTIEIPFTRISKDILET